MQRENTMTLQPAKKKTWLRKITLAAVTGLVAGIARAVIAWALDHLTSS
jgi:hypothetical protein